MLNKHITVHLFFKYLPYHVVYNIRESQQQYWAKSRKCHLSMRTLQSLCVEHCKYLRPCFTVVINQTLECKQPVCCSVRKDGFHMRYQNIVRWLLNCASCSHNKQCGQIVHPEFHYIPRLSFSFYKRCVLSWQRILNLDVGIMPLYVKEYGDRAERYMSYICFVCILYDTVQRMAYVQDVVSGFGIIQCQFF